MLYISRATIPYLFRKGRLSNWEELIAGVCRLMHIFFGYGRAHASHGDSQDRRSDTKPDDE